jgi:hypothetical protein
VPRITASIHTGRPTGNFLTKHVNQYKNEAQQKHKIVSETLYEKICKLGKCFKCGDKFVPSINVLLKDYTWLKVMRMNVKNLWMLK